MKKKQLLLLILAAAVTIAATSHDYFLLPENFFLHKGDKLNLHLLGGETFVNSEELGYQSKNTPKFMIYEGSKKTDLTKLAKDSASPVIDYTVLNSGQALIEMNRSAEYNDASRDNFADFLTSQGLDKMADKVKNANQFRIRQKITRYMKTLVSVDDHDGSLYGKVLNDDFEIILKDNPYKKKYGEDMAAQLKFQGKPAAGASVGLYIKTIKGTVYTSNLTTDKDGMVSFTMSREGIYMLRSVRIEPTKDKEADYESWWTSYTFPFSSSDEVPNTYKEFGFGNKH
jgi:uncharacterized GH25 family protein